MSSIFVSPLSFTVVSSNQNTLAPTSNASIDEPALTWRSSNLTTVNCIIDLGANAVSYDTVALIGTNLRATDTVQVRTGTTNTGIGSYAGTALAAFSGTAPTGTSAKAIYKLSSTRTERYIRIDIVSTGNPAGYTEAQRIVVGQSVSLTNGAGIDVGHEFSFVDQSVPYSGNGWRSYDRYNRLPMIKLTVSFIGDSDWRTSWFQFMQDVGQSKGFLLVPDDTQPANWQAEAMFGTISEKATATVQAFGIRRADITILAYAP